MAETAAPAHATAPRTRGQGFPRMPLGEAAEVIKRVGMYGRDHTLTAFAGYLGHGTTNSGPFRNKMAALRDWGFIEGQGEQIRLTEAAQQIAHPESTEHERTALRNAFSQAELFAAVYRDSAKGADLNLDLVGNRAVTGLGVAPRSKSAFAQSFAKSVVTAGLGELASEGNVRLLPPDAQPKETGDAGNAHRGPDQSAANDAGGRSEAAPAMPPSVSPPTIHQEWQVNGGALIFEARLDRPLPASSYSDLAEIAEAVEKLVASLGPPAGEEEPENGDAPE